MWREELTDGGLEVADLEGFFEEATHGRGWFGGEARVHDDGDLGGDLAEFAAELDPGASGHAVIGDDEAVSFGSELVQGVFGIDGYIDKVAHVFEHHTGGFAGIFFVIDQEHTLASRSVRVNTTGLHAGEHTDLRWG